MTLLPPDHPLRLVLADEVHARPPEPLHTPCRATYVALLMNPGDRERERHHIAALCQLHGVAPPAPGATHFSADIGQARLKWERHGEFSGFTVFVQGLSTQPFSEPADAALPAGWLHGLPGTTIVAARAQLVAATATPLDAAALSAHFDDNMPVGGAVGGGAGFAYTDFKVHADGFGRFLVCNTSLTERQAGRTLQRLFEIEAYRMMALLALPMAREMAPRIAANEATLAALTARLAAGGAAGGAVAGGVHAGDDDEALLQSLSRLAAETESMLSTSQFRFGACAAYHALVTTRISELRGGRIAGIQPIDEFMAHRLAPAVATCATASQRLHGLSERVAQVTALLSTRVGIAREQQNQSLLASMDRRAKLQLRLQQTVEGLSVAAIVYYVAGLLGYLAKAGKVAGLPWQPDLLVGLAIPVVALVVLAALRRARRRLHHGGAETDAAHD